ncbi:MAG: thiamine-phosphate kinase [Bacteroidales bacterium]|nr:thiamine-phosphate kinase [Bacteroidales bacterium]MBN2756836.1 thiamine-phosphate kinase [Bacteroidales bacterium]
MAELSELGEFGLIKHLTKDIKIINEQTIKGVGDDAAVLDYSDEKIVITSDLLVEGVHFDLAYVPLKHLGYKAVVVNISDVIAMNAKPRQIIVSIAISNRFGLEAIDELYSGIHLACKNYGVDLVGGDTTSSKQGLFISITAIGGAKQEEIVYRSTAKENDLICVTGDLGAAYMGLQLLERENEIFKADPQIQPDLSGYNYILQRQLKPEARYDVCNYLNNNNITPNSLIDISDGLSSEIMHICNNSNVGCQIYEDKIPINDETIKMAEEFGINPLVCALNGGEDYELLFTVDLNDYEKLKANNQISVIGHITKQNQGTNMIRLDNSIMDLSAEGWNAFMKK